MPEDNEENMSDDEVIMKIAAAMKDNVPVGDEKDNVHTFLKSVVTEKDTTRIGNLRDDKDLNELGIPQHNVRGNFSMAQISKGLMDNDVFFEWFNNQGQMLLSTSLSREGFLVRQATTQTKNIGEITKKRVSSKGLFGKDKNVQEQGGDPYLNR